MLIIGERINSTRPQVREAIRARNSSFIAKEAHEQLKSGAEFIDINCAVTSGDEPEDMEWAVSVIQGEANSAGICIDSPSHLAIERALKIYKGKGQVFINSITAEDERIKHILPLASRYGTKLIALAMDGSGMPDSAEGRLEMTKKILEKVKRVGFNPEDIYIDPLIRPISTEPAQAKEFLHSIPMIKSLGVKTACGLSNVSFGLPSRSLINAVFLSMAYQAGLDAAILDPLDKHVMSAVRAAKALLSEDDYCVEYIKAYRNGKLV
jgi:5-methyltetrahydrofolate--homocysteine methyltransferase